MSNETEKTEVKTETEEKQVITSPVAASQPNTGNTFLTIFTLVLVMLAFGLFAWSWLQSNNRFLEVEQALSVKLNEYQGVNQQGLALAKQADERTANIQAKILMMEEKLAESQNQQEVLQTLYDQLAENHETAVLTKVEQFVSIANQQLRLSGNIKSALLALQSADAPLEALNLPRATQLREVLGDDINRLREFPQVDMLDLSSQLASLGILCENLPLVSDRKTETKALVEPVNTVANLDGNTVQNIGEQVWAKLKRFVTIERIDNPEPPLLSADHRFYLKENLKLRLLTTRIALMQRDEVSYQADLQSVSDWISQYYDTQHPNAEKALALVTKLQAKQIGADVPELNDSLDAIDRYKLMLDNQ